MGLDFLNLMDKVSRRRTIEAWQNEIQTNGSGTERTVKSIPRL
jgi:hypothetical protein